MRKARPSPPPKALPAARGRAIPEKFQPLCLGSVRPTGWLRRQLAENLDRFTGHLDELAPGLLVRDEIYGRDRLSRSIRSKDVGARAVPEDEREQLLWWNSETQANWWDGFVRTAVLLGRSRALDRARRQVAAVVSTQDRDGYMGIYAPDLRYRFDGGENGELWSKATLFRWLLGWQEHAGDEKVLRSVVRGVKNLMANYPAGRSHPFRSARPSTSGLSHGLAITDVLESLHRRTGDPSYLDYLLFCYRDFSSQPLDEDAKLERLLDARRPLRGHGVHTYEHLRSVAAAYQSSGEAVLGRALRNFLRKIEPCVTASGGPVGDERIGGTDADGGERGYEYCSLQELLHSCASLLLKTGRMEFADRIERLFFNAAQGARHPRGSGIAYLKSDNSYAMNGPLNFDTSHPEQNRYKYSPAHQDVAVCCAPNAGRIGPYYVQSMWMREGNALVAPLLGPCEVRTEINGHPVRIVEETEYPFGDTLGFRIRNPGATFELRIRRPAWAVDLRTSEPCRQQDGMRSFSIRPSAAGRKLTVRFGRKPAVHRDRKGDCYFTFGALVLSHALAARETVARRYPVPGFADLKYAAVAPVVYRCPPGAEPKPSPGRRLRFEVGLLNSETHRVEKVLLEPMGGTILRQTTFPPASGRAPAPRRRKTAGAIPR